MRRTVSLRRPLRRSRRAAVLVWFAGMFLATAGLVGSISVDYGRILLVRSQVEAVAQDAAVAAARTYDTSSSLPEGALLLDENAARSLVQNLVADAGSLGNLKGASDVTVSVTVAQRDALWWQSVDPANPAGATPPRVTVTIRYRVGDLLLMDLLAAVTGGTKTVIQGTATASAVICIPGANPDTLGGSCVRSGS